jgi:hypothetical protein
MTLGRYAVCGAQGWAVHQLWGSAPGTEAVRQLGQADVLQGAQFVSHGMERVAWELLLGLLDNGVLPRHQTVVRAADRDAAGLSSCMCT